MYKLKIKKKEIEELPITERIGIYYLLNKKNNANVLVALGKGNNTPMKIRKSGVRASNMNITTTLKEFEKRQIVEKVDNKIRNNMTFKLTELGVRLLLIIMDKCNLNISQGLNKKKSTMEISDWFEKYGSKPMEVM